ncbi:Uncharacterised protein [Mycobacterium tuberculosis]|nr:Uncharacterised protein [Mycobacterium tuberculosis]
MLECRFADIVIIDTGIFLAYAISCEVIQNTGCIDRAAVSQVAAVCQVHAQDRLPWLYRSKVYGHVRLCAGVRLNVRMLCTEQFFRAVACDVLNDVNVFAAAIVTLIRVAFCIFVGQYGTHGLKHRLADKVFGCDQLDFVTLTAELQIHCFHDFRILFTQKFHVGHPP